MTEITQADRDAAMRWAGALPRGDFEHLLTIADDAAIKTSMEERAAIVAWLRGPEPYPDGNDIADAIEAGEHLK